MNLKEKLQRLQFRFEDLKHLMNDLSLMQDLPRYVAVQKEYKDLQPIIEQYDLYLQTEQDLAYLQEMLQDQDPQTVAFARQEIKSMQATFQQLEADLKERLIPADPEDNKNAILEIRAGTGGDEACIFVANIYRMYTMFFKDKNWIFETLSLTEGAHGIKEVVLEVVGNFAYGWLKYESGVHRVQRVPETEAQGRVHTSAITVAVLPEVEEFEFALNMNDIRKDTFRASGAGGQHINKTESAVRLTHVPSGMVVECQDGRSQLKNYEKALQVLRSRLYEQEMQKRHQERAEHRKLLVSTGDRSAKIRTYNYPQARVTDHRINLTLHSLDQFMAGKLEPLLKALKLADNTEKMLEQEAEK